MRNVNKIIKGMGAMGKVQLGRDLAKDKVEDIKAFLISLTGVIPQDALEIPLLPSIE